jgi:acetyltransferase
VADAFQNRGLGVELLRRVISVAQDEKLSCVSSEMLSDNLSMQVISKKLGFRLQNRLGSPSIRAVLRLD